MARRIVSQRLNHDPVVCRRRGTDAILPIHGNAVERGEEYSNWQA
jgi:hypothetical protein